MLVRKLQLWIIVDDFRGIAARFSNEHWHLWAWRYLYLGRPGPTRTKLERSDDGKMGIWVTISPQPPFQWVQWATHSSNLGCLSATPFPKLKLWALIEEHLFGPTEVQNALHMIQRLSQLSYINWYPPKKLWVKWLWEALKENGTSENQGLATRETNPMSFKNSLLAMSCSVCSVAWRCRRREPNLDPQAMALWY